jgi:hypothetical protein
MLGGGGTAAPFVESYLASEVRKKMRDLPIQVLRWVRAGPAWHPGVRGRGVPVRSMRPLGLDWSYPGPQTWIEKKAGRGGDALPHSRMTIPVRFNAVG